MRIKINAPECPLSRFYSDLGLLPWSKTGDFGEKRAKPDSLLVTVRIHVGAGGGDVSVKSDGAWSDFQITLAPMPAATDANGAPARVLDAWVEVNLPSPGGKIWLDGFRMVEAK